MLEYFSYKKIKKHRDAKKDKEDESKGHTKDEGHEQPETEHPKESNETGQPKSSTSSNKQPQLDREPSVTTPVLDKEDEAFLESIITDDGPAPPLPPRVPTGEATDWTADYAASTREPAKEPDDPKGKKKEKSEQETKKQNRLSFLFTRHKKHGDSLKPEDATSTIAAEAEEQKEEADINRVLDRLNLTAKNNKVISLSEESTELLQKFTQIFKDLANGVPTAYDDLVGLIKDRDSAMTKGFEKLPSSLQKLVTQLPEKLTASIAPEVLAAAAKSQGIEMAAELGIKEAAQQMFLPQNIFELLTKPGALVGMLRAIVTALKARWPAFIGMNVIWSVALFLLMFMLWYCHKRGREVRLEQEQANAAVDGSDRIEELPDDPLLKEASSVREAGSEQESAAAGAPERAPEPARLEAPPATAETLPINKGKEPVKEKVKANGTK